MAQVLRIGCLPHVPIQRLLALLGALRLRDPRLETWVWHGRPVEQLDRLGDGALDVAMLHQACAHPGVETEAVFAGERIAAFLPPGGELAAKRVLRPTDLLDVDLVIFPRDGDPALLEHIGAEIDRSGYRFRGVVEASGHHVRDVLLEVAHGRGIALGPSSLAMLTDARSIVVRRTLDPPLTMPDTVLAWQAHRYDRLKERIDVVRDVARDLRHARPRSGR